MNIPMEDVMNPNQPQLQPQHSAPTFFKHDEPDNVVKWQLDIAEELERIENLLRKYIPKTDKDGKTYFAKPAKEDELFNEYGINEILNLLAWYLNKNIILSNFTKEEIAMRCKQFHHQLTDFIFNNYKKFGLDTKDKIKHYPMIVMNLVNTIEAAYNRALHGGERKSIQGKGQIMQTEQLGYGGQMGGMGMPMQPQKKFSIFKPTSWIK